MVQENFLKNKKGGIKLKKVLVMVLSFVLTFNSIGFCDKEIKELKKKLYQEYIELRKLEKEFCQKYATLLLFAFFEGYRTKNTIKCDKLEKDWSKFFLNELNKEEKKELFLDIEIKEHLVKAGLLMCYEGVKFGLENYPVDYNDLYTLMYIECVKIMEVIFTK